MTFPQLTEERRKELVKEVSKMAEETKITVQFVVFIYYRQLLDSMFLQNLRNSLHIRRRIGSNDVLLSHYLIDTLIHIFLKTKVTIGNNAYQISFIIYHRNTTNLVFSHQSQRISYRRTSLDSHRVITSFPPRLQAVLSIYRPEK